MATDVTDDALPFSWLRRSGEQALLMAKEMLVSNCCRTHLRPYCGVGGEEEGRAREASSIVALLVIDLRCSKPVRTEHCPFSKWRSQQSLSGTKGDTTSRRPRHTVEAKKYRSCVALPCSYERWHLNLRQRHVVELSAARFCFHTHHATSFVGREQDYERGRDDRVAGTLQARELGGE